jgi:hypothetical protein
MVFKNYDNGELFVGFPIFTEKIQHIYLSVSETIMFGPWEVKIISYLKKNKKHEKDSHALRKRQQETPNPLIVSRLYQYPTRMNRTVQ